MFSCESTWNAFLNFVLYDKDDMEVWYVLNLSEKRKPQRVILIRFGSRDALDACFSSKEYQEIKMKRANSVNARAIIVEGMRQ